jgi:hypothetical protein
MQCTKCSYNGKLSRIRRVGFLEKHLYSLFGYFPWICSGCKQRLLLKSRGVRRRSHRDEDSGSIPTPHADEKGLHQIR